MRRAFALAGLFFIVFSASFFASSRFIHTPTELSYERIATTTDIIVAASTTPQVATSTEELPKETPLKKAADKPKASTPAVAVQEKPAPEEEGQVYRIEAPYSTQPKSADELNNESRGALVNIFCLTQSGKIGSISGSGTIIDPRGVILTNAHVAQYVLLSSQPEIALECTILSGAPATAKWKAEVLFIPSSWVSAHAKDIVVSKAKGTGEYDYALLLITKSTSNEPLPPAFPYLTPDIREAIAFKDDSVLLAGFPAEFAGGSMTRSSLYASTVYTRIKELLTFVDRSVDLVSLGNIVLAQSGSSGGAVINMWGRIVGVITTTSEGATTGERELHAITLSYISRDMEKHTGLDLKEFLQGDVISKAATFMMNEAPALAKQIISHIP